MNMWEENHDEENNPLQKWLAQYYDILAGKMAVFLEEDAFIEIVEYLDDTETIKKAEEAVDVGLTYYPFSAALQIKKADFLIVEKKYKEALAILDTAASYDSQDYNIVILKTDAQLGLNNLEEAEAILQEALQQYEGEECVDMLFELAEVYDDYELFDKVFYCLQTVLKIEPNNEEALYKICFWTDFAGYNAESVEIHQQIIDEYPYNELAWFNLGAAYQGVKLYEKAIDAYKYAVAINDKFDYAYRNMGDAYMRLRKYREAIEVLVKTLELATPESILYEAIGYCYHKLSNCDEARFYYQNAIHLSPTESKLYYKIALTFMDEHQWTKALKSIETAMAFNQNSFDYDIVKAECLMNLEQYTEAIHYLGNAVNNRNKSVVAWSNFIKCMYLVEDYDTAAEQALCAYEYTGNKSIFLFYHAFALYAMGQIDDALFFIETGLKQSPKQFKKALELNPNILQNNRVVDLLARYRKKTSK